MDRERHAPGTVRSDLQLGDGGRRGQQGRRGPSAGGNTFIVYSASHCSTPDHKLGMLTYNGGDPLSSSSWVKSPNPVFQRSSQRCVRPRAQKFTWNAEGTPNFGTPVALGVTPTAPSAE